MRALAVALVLAITPAAIAAPAEPDVARQKEARMHFQQGARAYSAGRYKQAIDEFLTANRLVPSPALSFNIARAHEKIGDDAGALAFYRDYLRRAPEAPDRARIEKRVHELELALRARGVQQVTVTSTPERATVVIDGTPVGITPWTGQIAPGQHRVTLRLARHREREAQFTLASHKALDVHYVLEPETTAAAPVAPAAAPQPSIETAPPRRAPAPTSPRAPQADDEAARVSAATWVTLGVGAVCLGAAVGAELRRSALEDDAHSARTQVEAKERYDEMESWQTTARVLGAGGAIVTLVGGALLYLDLSSRPGPQVGASCARPGCAVGVRGSF